MRGFIDDLAEKSLEMIERAGLNPRSCAASSMTRPNCLGQDLARGSQSAFVRGFIDDG